MNPKPPAAGFFVSAPASQKTSEFSGRKTLRHNSSERAAMTAKYGTFARPTTDVRQRPPSSGRYAANFSALRRAKGMLLLLRHIEIGQRAREASARHGEGLGQRRVRVDGQADVLGVGAHLDRQRRLGDEVARVRPDDAAADEAAASPRPTAVLVRPSSRPSESDAAARRPREHRLAVLDACALASVSVTPAQATSGSV